MDIELTERGNGGEWTAGNGDLLLVEGVENVPYLAMFGGGEWWANDLLLADETTACQYQCRTEKALRTYALNSDGRQAIEQAALADLQDAAAMLDGDAAFATGGETTTVRVAVTITDVDAVEIKGEFGGRAFVYQWNPRLVESR
jgi:phage gp46-like protein